MCSYEHDRLCFMFRRLVSHHGRLVQRRSFEWSETVLRRLGLRGPQFHVNIALTDPFVWSVPETALCFTPARQEPLSQLTEWLSLRQNKPSFVPSSKWETWQQKVDAELVRRQQMDDRRIDLYVHHMRRAPERIAAAIYTVLHHSPPCKSHSCELPHSCESHSFSFHFQLFPSGPLWNDVSLYVVQQISAWYHFECKQHGLYTYDNNFFTSPHILLKPSPHVSIGVPYNNNGVVQNNNGPEIIIHAGPQSPSTLFPIIHLVYHFPTLAPFPVMMNTFVAKFVDKLEDAKTFVETETEW